MSINKLGDLLKSIKFTSNKIAPKLKPTLNVCLKDIKNQWPKNYRVELYMEIYL